MERSEKSEEKRPTYSVVIPTYNEAKKEKEMRDHLDSIEKYFETIGQSYEVLIVLDGPNDGKTPQLVKNIVEGKPNFIVIDRKENRGKGYSVREGLLRARGQIRLFTDMDGATPINMLDRFIPKVSARGRYSNWLSRPKGIRNQNPSAQMERVGRRFWQYFDSDGNWSLGNQRYSVWF